MEIYERIKELRKNHLKMSQTAFGERLGVSRSVINNIELNALAKPDQKLSLYKLICSEFNVSEDWLLHGTGDMYANKEAEYSTLIDQIMTGENEFAKNIFKTFAQFDEKDWKALQHVMDKFTNTTTAEYSNDLATVIDSIPDDPAELERMYPPVEKAEKKKA